MKFLLIIFLLGFVSSSSLLDDECPHDLEVKCVDSVYRAYKICEVSGIHEKVHLKCMKYLVTDKDCWPCICFIAEQAKWKIIDCNSSEKVVLE